MPASSSLSAAAIMGKQFQPVTGEIVSLGLAAVNPHRDLRTCELMQILSVKLLSSESSGLYRNS